jgi:hypothetical protein
LKWYDAMLQSGVPEHVRLDNGPEMFAEALREWLGKRGTKPLYIEPGQPVGEQVMGRQRAFAKRLIGKLERHQPSEALRKVHSYGS